VGCGILDLLNGNHARRSQIPPRYRRAAYGKMGILKTTVEIPDPLYRRAKAAAAQKGIPLKQLFTEALREQLRRHTPGQKQDKPWMQAFGGLRDLHKENKRLERIIAPEFESIDEEDFVP
jgi:hypothetical protein